jgi:hypothetical protein
MKGTALAAPIGELVADTHLRVQALEQAVGSVLTSLGDAEVVLRSDIATMDRATRKAVGKRFDEALQRMEQRIPVIVRDAVLSVVSEAVRREVMAAFQASGPRAASSTLLVPSIVRGVKTNNPLAASKRTVVVSMPPAFSVPDGMSAGSGTPSTAARSFDPVSRNFLSSHSRSGHQTRAAGNPDEGWPGFAPRAGAAPLRELPAEDHLSAISDAAGNIYFVPRSAATARSAEGNTRWSSAGLPTAGNAPSHDLSAAGAKSARGSLPDPSAGNARQRPSDAASPLRGSLHGHDAAWTYEAAAASPHAAAAPVP